jgi:hypothetical protein
MKVLPFLTSILTLVTPLVTFAAVEFGPIPGEILIHKAQCIHPTLIDRCPLPTSADVREELSLFVKHTDRRRAVIESRIPLLAKAAKELREAAGQDQTLRSFAYYKQAAERVADIAKSEDTLAALNFFSRSQSPVIKDLQHLLSILLNFESQIAQASDSKVKEGLEVGRNVSVLKLMNEIHEHANWARHYQWRYFKTDLGIVTKPDYASRNDPRNFNLSEFANIVSLCGSGDTGLDQIGISAAAQKDDLDRLTLLDDQAVIKGILDNPVPLTFQCERVFSTPQLLYNKGTHTVTRQYFQRGYPLTKKGDEVTAPQSSVGLLRQIFSSNP